MNSAASTDPQSLTPPRSGARDGDPLQPWQFFTLAGLVGATIVVFLSEGQTPAGIILLSLIIFGAAAVGAAAWRTFSPLSGLDEPAGPQLFGGRTRAALEREKSLVLRSIKDLEFDHAMGKVSDKDFSEMGARLRSRAAGLIRQLDAGTSYRQAIETEIERRVGKAPRPAATVPAATVPAVRAPAAAVPTDQPKTKLCLSCCTPNDPDARFCKGCGYQLGDW
jgi:hypothetical protein